MERVAGEGFEEGSDPGIVKRAYSAIVMEICM